MAELVGDPDRASGWTLLLDGAPQSHVDLAEPTYLEFEYIRRMAAAIDLIAPAGTPKATLEKLSADIRAVVESGEFASWPMSR